MTDSYRAAVLQQNSPTYSVPHASARAERYARPQNVLGAEPRRDVTYFTELARSLSSDSAAAVQPPLPPVIAPGARIDVQA